MIDHKTRQFGDQETSIAEPEKRAIRRSKYSKVIDRLVEDLIQEAMSKGEFQNLSGSGKPLKLEQELYVGRCNVCDQNQNHHNLQKDFEDVLLACVRAVPPQKKKHKGRWCGFFVGEGCYLAFKILASRETKMYDFHTPNRLKSVQCIS